MAFGYRGGQVVRKVCNSAAARGHAVFGGSRGRQRCIVRRLPLLQVTLTGYASDTLDGAALRHAIRSISGWVSRGVIQAPVRRVFPLGEAAAAHAQLEQHLVQGRVLLVPGH